MPIPLGILAAAGVRPAAGGSYEWIETYTVGAGGIASVTFDVSSYSTTYQHLQIRAVARSTRASDNDPIGLRFNSDTGTNYRWHFMEGNGSSVSSSDSGAANSIGNYFATASNSASGSFGVAVIDILDAYEAKNKTTRTLGGRLSVSGVQLTSGLWLNTASISSVNFYSITGNSFAQYSRFSIYGLKAS